MERFRVISKLGAGGCGEAFRAWDNQEGVPVVLKRPLAKYARRPDAIERFDREITRLLTLTHPNIVPIVSHGRGDDGLPYLVMRFLPAGSLADRKKPQPFTHLHQWLSGIAAALDHVHACGVIHRDVKPANIFFDTKSSAYLGDFGIAKIVDEELNPQAEESLTCTGDHPGTGPYMGPEFFRKPRVLSGAYDQYALAITVYEMICGRRPFTGDSGQLIVAHVTQDPPDIQQIRQDAPSTFCQAVLRALSKSPEERFATCTAFAKEALRDIPPATFDDTYYRFLCPACHKLVRVRTGLGGKRGRCPDCNASLRVSEHCDALWRQEEAPSASADRRLRRSRAPFEHGSNESPVGGQAKAFSGNNYGPIGSAETAPSTPSQDRQSPQWQMPEPWLLPWGQWGILLVGVLGLLFSWNTAYSELFALSLACAAVAILLDITETHFYVQDRSEQVFTVLAVGLVIPAGSLVFAYRLVTEEWQEGGGLFVQSIRTLAELAGKVSFALLIALSGTLVPVLYFWRQLGFDVRDLVHQWLFPDSSEYLLPTQCTECNKCYGIANPNDNARGFGCHEFYTDLFTTDAFRYPAIIKCPYCGSLSWRDGMPISRLPKPSIDHAAELEPFHRPTESECLASINTPLVNSDEKHRLIRTVAWWLSNDRYRDHRNLSDTADGGLCDESRCWNMECLFSMLPDESDDRDRFMKAELARELGLFEVAERLLAMKYGSEWKEDVDYVTSLVREKKTQVELIRSICFD